MKNTLLTEGAGFIVSHLVRLFVNKYPAYNIFNLDALIYAIDATKINGSLGWSHSLTLEEGLSATIDW